MTIEEQMTADAALVRGKFMKKTGKKADPKDLEALKHKFEKYKMEEKRWQKNLKNFPQQLTSQKEDIIKLTKDQLKNIKKGEKYEQEVKIICDGSSHKLEIKKTILSGLQESKEFFRH